MSFSLALPTNKKFFERTLLQASLADTETGEAMTIRIEKRVARTRASRFVISFPFGKKLLELNWSSKVLSLETGEGDGAFQLQTVQTMSRGCQFQSRSGSKD